MAIPVLKVAQMREWERAAWAAGQTQAEVIRRVGKKIARRARKLTRSDDLILILAGKGHNGDDASAARDLLEGRRVEILAVTAPEDDLPKLQQALDQKPALIIDGLFGIGLNRPLADCWKKFITAVNQSNIPVLAVDIPSGLNADTGENFGAAIEAEVTVTVGAPKAGMLADAAWPFVGRLEVAEDVGLGSRPPTGDLNWTLPEDFENFPPRRAVAGHKGVYGHLAVVAGSMGFHGAAVLAARAAQRAQPGLITLFTPEEVYYPVAAQLQAVMVGGWKPDLVLDEGVTAMLFGPGLASPDLPREMKAMFRRLWRGSPFPLVADASALDWLSPYPFPPGAIRVITPHPGEAARLLKRTVQKVQADRTRSVRDLSRRFSDCWVVLKGYQTLIGRSEGETFVNSSGNPHLAQGGSGDVLAGFLAGLLAQPALQADVAKTIRYAVWQHGAAADALEAECSNWVVEDLVDRLGNER